jgi:hypothetical protein
VEHIAVESSMLISVAYDAKEQILEVKFKQWEVYQYFEVPSNVFEELLKAESKGRYMRSYVIDCYPYVRVR